MIQKKSIFVPSSRFYLRGGHFKAFISTQQRCCNDWLRINRNSVTLLCITQININPSHSVALIKLWKWTLHQSLTLIYRVTWSLTFPSANFVQELFELISVLIISRCWSPTSTPNSSRSSPGETACDSSLCLCNLKQSSANRSDECHPVRDANCFSPLWERLSLYWCFKCSERVCFLMLLTARKCMMETILKLQMGNAYLHQQAGVVIWYYNVQYTIYGAANAFFFLRKWYFEVVLGSLAV